ncbi:unnamed protein product [Leuciscus chuanchicus]
MEVKQWWEEDIIVTRPNSGGSCKILTDQQEQAVVDLVRARNDIRLTEIRQHILDNEDMFTNVGSISLPTIARILKRHQDADTVLEPSQSGTTCDKNPENIKGVYKRYLLKQMEAIDIDIKYKKLKVRKLKLEI